MNDKVRDNEILDLVTESANTISSFVIIDDAIHVRCADGKLRPVDRELAYRLEELQWSQRLIAWKLKGRVGEAPKAVRRTYNPIRSILDRISVMLGKEL